MVTARVRKDCSMASSLKDRLEKFYFAASGDECWLWRGATTGKPTHQYGVIKVKGKMIKAHRLSYELYNRTSIPTGMVIDHICRVTRCINPKHLRTDTEDLVDELKKNPNLLVRGIGGSIAKEALAKIDKLLEEISK